MSARWESLALTLVSDLERVFGRRLLSVAVYGPALDSDAGGPLSTLVLTADLSADDLEACAQLAARWARAGIETPLILPEKEFARSLDTFPVEYTDIQASYRVVSGRAPFHGVSIDAEDLRRACEHQAKSHLLHLREGYIESHGNPRAVAKLVVASTPAFSSLLRSVAGFLGITAPTRGDVALAGALALSLDEAVVRQILSLEGGHAATADGARLFPSYLAVVDQLAHAVDTWRQ